MAIRGGSGVRSYVPAGMPYGGRYGGGYGGYGYGLRSMYMNRNPYDRRIQQTGQIMQDSGLAKPLLALAMGADMNKAQEWDEGQSLNQQDQADYQMAKDVFSEAINLSKDSPTSATKFIKTIAADHPDNKFLGSFKDFEFNTPTSSDWIVSTKGKKAYMINQSRLDELAKDPNNESLKSQIMMPIGDGEDAGGKTIGNVDTSKYTGESIDKFNKSGNYADLVPVVDKQDKQDALDARNMRKEFEQEKGKLYELYGKKATIQAGYNPAMNFAEIPQDSRDAASAEIQRQVQRQEDYMKTMYPDLWKAYKPNLTIGAPPQGAVDALHAPGAGSPPPPAPSGAAPPPPPPAPGPADNGGGAPPPAPPPSGGPGKPLDAQTATQILMRAGGDKDKARQIAGQMGYSF